MLRVGAEQPRDTGHDILGLRTSEDLVLSLPGTLREDVSLMT